MSVIGSELQGADQLVRTLADAAEQLQNLDTAQQTAGRLLTETASSASPRRTGQLAEAHAYDVVDTRVIVTAATPYAERVHARKPWLADTLTAKVDEVTTIYADAVTDALATVKGT